MEETLGRVLKHDKAIIAVCEAAAEVDCLLSLSLASLLHNWAKPEMTEENVLEIRGGTNWAKPEMTEENVLEIRGGTHPLQSLLVPTFVPNDAHLVGGKGIKAENEGEDEKSIMICTGANACGKIGCFVPAQSARLGIVDKSLAGTTKLHSPKPYNIGRGSLSTDGAGLFAGVISQLLKRGNDCPKVFASTHFHELFTRGLIPPELPISYAYMKVLLNSSVVEEGQRQAEITYLYKVTPGLCLDSYAAQCARVYGINKSIVERARFASMVVSRNEIGLLLDEGMPREQMEELEVRAAICQRFVSWKMSVDDDVGVKDRLREVLGK
ncbi:unnamed protein product [Rhizoctonia solani]|uniref:DNA mismatch repair proteins mutS family domain-containing protein n=1 Tax=Rhizoctonia solani TaxID=456999 RepID=A0A8H3BWZ1_9AGAM|nr:unnamed protein product [Rhizoctonia solani]